MRDIEIPNGLGEVGYAEGDVDDLVEGAAQAAAAAGHRAQGRHRGRPRQSSVASSCGDTGEVTGQPVTRSSMWPSCGRRGVADVDDSVLARALYSSDASLYRVVPQVVVRPRAPDELAAVLASRGAPAFRSPCAAPAPRSPATPSGRASSSTRRDTSTGSSRSTPRRGPAVVQPGVVHATLQRGRAHGLRFGPDPSTHTRCTIGGMIGNNACGSRALGYGRTADNVVALRRRWEPGRRGTSRRRSAALVDQHLAHVRTEFGRFSRQVSGYSLEHLLPENGRRSTGSWSAPRAPSRVVPEPRSGWSRTRPTGCCWCSATRRWPRRRTPCPRCCRAAGSSPARAWTRASSTWCARGDRRAGAAARAAAGCSWRSPGASRRGPRPWPRARRSRAPRAPARRRRGRGSRAVADPRGRRRLAARSLTAPAHAGWEDAAVPPERLGRLPARLRRAAGEHGLDGVPYGHFGDGCVHVRIDFPLDRAGGRRRSSGLPRPPARSAARPRRLAVRRARRRPGPLRAAAADVRRRVAAPVRRGQGALRPAQPAQPRHPGRPRAARRRPAAGPRAPGRSLPR